MTNVATKQVIDKNGTYVNWDKKKMVRLGLAAGTYYATYYDDGVFCWWQSRKEIRAQLKSMAS